MADLSNKITGYEQKMGVENDDIRGELYDWESEEDNSVGNISGNVSANYTVDQLLEMYLGPKQVGQSTKIGQCFSIL